MFYTSLGRLLMVDLGEDEERFYNFMLPLTSMFHITIAVVELLTFLNASLNDNSIFISIDLNFRSVWIDWQCHNGYQHIPKWRSEESAYRFVTWFARFDIFIEQEECLHDVFRLDVSNLCLQWVGKISTEHMEIQFLNIHFIFKQLSWLHADFDSSNRIVASRPASYNANLKIVCGIGSKSLATLTIRYF